MKSYIFLLLLFIIITPPSYGAPPEDDNANLTGKAIQLSLDQNEILLQIAQIYTLQLLEEDNIIYQNKITAYSKLFEYNFSRIKEFKLITAPIHQIDSVLARWKTFKKFVTAPPQKKQLSYLLLSVDSLSTGCALITEQLIQSTLPKINYTIPFQEYHELSHLIQQASYQNIACERIVLYYLIAQLTSKIDYAATIIKHASKTYAKNIDLLKQSPLNTPAIDYKIYQLEYEWNRMQVLCDNIEQFPKIKRSEVFAIRDYLTTQMDQIEERYVQLMDQKVASVVLLEILPIATQQRKLTQSITRAYLAVTMEIETNEQQLLLVKDSISFEKNLNLLAAYTPNIKIQKAVQEIYFLWKNYRSALAQKENRSSNTSKLLQYNTELLRVCNNLVILYKLYGKSIPPQGNFNKTALNILDKTYKQAMLSERVLLYYMATEWSPKSKIFNKLLNKSIGQYNRGLQEIKRSSYLSGAMQKHLVLIFKNWQANQKIVERSRAIPEALIIKQVLTEDLLALALQIKDLSLSPTKNQAVNISTRLGMLTQKITNHILLHSIDQKNQLLLQKDLQLFDSQLAALQTYISTPKEILALERLQKNWSTYKESILDNSAFDFLPKELLAISSKLLSNSDLLSTRIFTDNRKMDLKTTTAISMAGHQRTQFQKLILFLLLERKQRSSKNKKIIQNLLDAYSFTHRNLTKFNLSSPDIKKHLQQIELTTINLQNSLSNSSSLTFKQIIWYHHILLAETENLVMAYQNLKLNE